MSLRTPRPGAATIALATGLALCAAGAAQAQAAAPAEPPRQALRVCQDPNNLPFSSTNGQGIENRIADIFGKALGLPVTYYSFPNRMAFIRNTLRYKLPGQDFPCDIVMGVPVGFDQVSVTQPYYRSSYAMAFLAGKTPALAQVRSSADLLALPPEVLGKLRIGLYDRSPVSQWLVKHNLTERAVPYPMLSPDPEQYPGEIIEKDLNNGRIDVAMVWGPIAGYFAQRIQGQDVRVIPMRSEPGVRLDFEIAMGVRHGEKPWKDQIEALIQSRRSDIQGVLRDFGVPLVDASFAAAPAAR